LTPGRTIDTFRNKICIYYGFGEGLYIYDMELILRMKILDIKNKGSEDDYKFSQFNFMGKNKLICLYG